MDLNGAPRDRRAEALGDLQLLPDEVISSILSLLSPRDVARLACVSSVMYIFCTEEPLWMILCLQSAGGSFQYKGSWKRTLLHLENVQIGDEESLRRLHFDGFYSMFLYKRMYRCCTTLAGFYIDNGNVERKKDMTLEEFQQQYDGKKPVMLDGLADTWPARKTWTVDGLLKSYGETSFKISQRNARKITMKFKDYVSYMEIQHDEDPLYIFDDKFGEVAPSLLKDYDVPDLFREDFFDVLEREQRPPFRWLIIGPERSGASWHVDPALTSAWNTLLCGRKRWALYPPGRVPVGVTVHVNEEDGDVNIETPTSLQWWLDYYPLLPDEEKPIECTQLPGETIFVPSGWWHCVLNLENTIAVTQNFVNSKNFEYVCLDMAPGYRHKGVCRAGFIALGCDGSPDDMEHPIRYDDDCLSSKMIPSKGKPEELPKLQDTEDNDPTECIPRGNYEFPYEINFLSKFLEDDRDHYNSIWSSGNCIGQREMRDWLWKLWKAKPEMRELIWKGACLALNAGKWLERARDICKFHSLPSPTEEEKLPVGTGSNPVYLIAGNVIKICAEGGLESSLFGLGTELQFYNLVSEVKCTLKDHIPDILASGIIFCENGSHKIEAWDGQVLPTLLSNCSFVMQKDSISTFECGVWSKRLYEYNTAETQGCKSTCLAETSQAWPYIVTRRCSGKIFAELRESMSWEEALNLASFLGEQLHDLHLLHLPPLADSTRSRILQTFESSISCKATDVGIYESESAAVEWMLFVKILETRKKDVITRLTNWGKPIPANLIEKVHEYLPGDFEKFFLQIKSQRCSWVHSDVMDDNIYMDRVTECAPDSCHRNGASVNGNLVKGGLSWQPSYLIDFSNMSIGDPLVDIIPIHLDVFRGDARLLKQFLTTYKLPLWKRRSEDELAEEKSMRVSYLAMCYCILHHDNVLGAVFGLWEELRNASSWEEVEEKVWGDLNEYACFA